MAKPVISNIRPGDPDGNEWNLTLDFEDDFFAVNADDPDAYDALVGRLNTGIDLSDYGYVFLATNKSDTITGVDDGEEVEGDISGVIASGNGHDDITAGPGDHVIFSGNGKDTVTGGDGDDIIIGGNGTDKLSGGLGDDTIMGQNGKDCLNGGEGADELTGGNGPDKFLWQEVADFGDVVTDFTAGSDTLKFNVGAEEPEISIGNNDEVVDDGEVVIDSDNAIETLNIQAEIDANDNDTGTLFAFFDSDEGHAVIYYDANPSDPDDADAMLVAHLENITSLDELSALSTSDFMFV